MAPTPFERRDKKSLESLDAKKSMDAKKSLDDDDGDDDDDDDNMVVDE